MPSMEDLNKFEQSHYPDDHSWGLDKKIPVALIFVVVTQILVFTWHAATLSSEVKNNHTVIVQLSEQLKQVGNKYELIASASLTKEDGRRAHEQLKSELDDIDNRLRDIERTRFTKEMWRDYVRTQ